MAVTRQYLRDTVTEPGTGAGLTPPTYDLSETQGSPGATLTATTNSTSAIETLRWQREVGATITGTSFPISIVINQVGSVSMRWRVQRVNSSGVVQASSAYGAIHTTTGTFTDTLTLSTTWAAGDWLRLSFEHFVTGGHGNQTIGVAVQDASTYIDADITVASTTYDGSGTSRATAVESGAGEQAHEAAGSDAAQATQSGDATAPSTTYDATGTSAATMVQSGTAVIIDSGVVVYTRLTNPAPGAAFSLPSELSGNGEIWYEASRPTSGLFSAVQYRAVDNANRWLVTIRGDTGSLELEEWAGGTRTAIRISYATGLAVGASATIRVVLNGNVHTLYFNGVQVGTYTSPLYATETAGEIPSWSADEFAWLEVRGWAITPDVTFVNGSELQQSFDTETDTITVLYTPPATGHLFVAVTRQNANSTTLTYPAGFTPHAQDVSCGVVHRALLNVYSIPITADMVGVEQSWVFTFDAARRGTVVGFMYANVDPFAPVGAIYTDASDTDRVTAGGGSLSNADVSDGIFSVGITSRYGGLLSVTDLAGYTEVATDLVHDNAYQVDTWVGRKEAVASGAQTTPTFAASNDTGMIAFAMEVNVAPAYEDAAGISRATMVESGAASISKYRDVRSTLSVWGYPEGQNFYDSLGYIFSATSNPYPSFSSYLFALDVPRGAIISSAAFTAYGRNTLDWSTVSDLVLGAEQVDDATIITSSDYTTRYDDVGTTVIWAPTGTSGTVAGEEPIYGADIASVIQQIVNRPGWVAGNKIQIIINNVGSNAISYSWWDHSHATAAYRPRLEVSFSESPSGSIDATGTSRTTATESGAAQTVASAAGSDAVAVNETATAQGVFVAAGADGATIAQTGGSTKVALPIAEDSAAFTESGVPSALKLPIAADSFVATETGAVTSLKLPITEDSFAALEQGAAETSVQPTGTSTATMVQSGAAEVAGQILIDATGTDVAQTTQAGAAEIDAVAAGTDSASFTESGAAQAIGDPLAEDAFTTTESGSVATLGDPQAEDAAAFTQSSDALRIASPSATDSALINESGSANALFTPEATSSATFVESGSAEGITANVTDASGTSVATTVQTGAAILLAAPTAEDQASFTEAAGEQRVALPIAIDTFAAAELSGASLVAATLGSDATQARENGSALLAHQPTASSTATAVESGSAIVDGYAGTVYDATGVNAFIAVENGAAHRTGLPQASDSFGIVQTGVGIRTALPISEDSAATTEQAAAVGVGLPLGEARSSFIESAYAGLIASASGQDAFSTTESATFALEALPPPGRTVVAQVSARIVPARARDSPVASSGSARIVRAGED